MANKSTLNNFRDIVLQIKDIAEFYHAGISALGADSKYIRCRTPKDINGSVDIDSAKKVKDPDGARWDYVIGYGDKAYFVEVHPASTSNVKEVLAKVGWLNKWLNKEATLLRDISYPPFIWIPSGAVRINKNSTHYRQLAQEKILIKKVLDL